MDKTLTQAQVTQQAWLDKIATEPWHLFAYSQTSDGVIVDAWQVTTLDDLADTHHGLVWAQSRAEAWRWLNYGDAPDPTGQTNTARVWTYDGTLFV